MEITPIGKRGYLFQFGEGDSPWTYPTSVYVIDGRKNVFICDTHCGPISMNRVKEFIDREMPGKDIVVFNSHAHWHHCWGNCAFSSRRIVSHISCQQTLLEQGQWAISHHADDSNGKVELVAPTLTFSDSLRFDEDGVVFVHTPGHSADCSSCLDEEESVLYMGDLVEDPIPYLEWHHLDVYKETLRKILNQPHRFRISSHSGVVDESMLRKTLSYVTNVASGLKIRFDDKLTKDLHNCNMRALIVSRHEELAREILGCRFDFEEFIQVVAEHTERPLADLEKALCRFVSDRRDIL